jgi:Na+(H+)/acetate symporter ActP
MWSLATMFALPVLVLEDAGARRAARRSAEIFRARWGDGVRGTVAVEGVTIVALIPGVALFASGLVVGGAAGIALCVGGGLLLGATAALSRATGELFALAVYRHQVLGSGSFGLEPSSLDALIDLKGRGLSR